MEPKKKRILISAILGGIVLLAALFLSLEYYFYKIDTQMLQGHLDLLNQTYSHRQLAEDRGMKKVEALIEDMQADPAKTVDKQKVDEMLVEVKNFQESLKTRIEHGKISEELGKRKVTGFCGYLLRKLRLSPGHFDAGS